MKKHSVPLVLSVISMLALGQLTACQKKNNNSSSIRPSQTRPAEKANVTDTKAQKLLQNGGADRAKSLQTQVNPQTAATGATGVSGVAKPAAKPDECAWAKTAKEKEDCADNQDDGEDASDDTNVGAAAPSGTVAPTGKIKDAAGKVTPVPADPAVAAGEGDPAAPAPKMLTNEFTSASDDGYRPHLMTLLATKMDATKMKADYYKTAEAITRVKAYATDDILNVTVFYKEGGKEKMSILGGPLRSEDGTARLVAMNKSLHKDRNVDQSLFGKTAISGVAVCADLESSNCHVMVIRLQVGEKKVPVWVIHRVTNANISNPVKSDFAGIDSLKTFYTYFANTERHTIDSVKTVMMDSFEVIHGASGMKISVVMQDNQVVSARGPLLAPKESILTNVPWKLDAETEDLYEVDSGTGFKTNLQNSVRGVNLITNDGKSEFTLNYGFKTTSGKAGDYDVTFQRLHPAVRDLEDIRTVLQKLRVGSEL